MPEICSRLFIMKIFLSYAAADKKWAESLRKMLPVELEGLSGPRKVMVWDPAIDVEPGENWRLESGKALEEADAIVVLLSPDSMKSEFVRQEIEYGLASPHFRGRVIPVLLKPTKDVPWILRKMPFIEAGLEWSTTVSRVADALKKSTAIAVR